MFQKFHQLFNQHKALYLYAQQYSGHEILKQLGIQPGAPVIVFKGGDNQMMGKNSHYLEPMIHEGIARAAGELRATVVDGGADSGMLGLLNIALRERHHPGHYIGVAPSALTHLPDQPNNGHLIALGDAHTHFILVEGENWGDEIPVLNAVIGALAKKIPYLMISINDSGVRKPNREKNNKDDENTIKMDYVGFLEDKILLQLCYPIIIENSGLQKTTWGETFSVVEIDAEPEKLANKIRYFLKIYSGIKKKP